MKQTNTCRKQEPNYKKLRLNSEEYRKQFLWEQATAEEVAGNMKACHAIKQILKVEEVRNTFRILGYYLKKISSFTDGHNWT